jgi:hypothetical protein
MSSRQPSSKAGRARLSCFDHLSERNMKRHPLFRSGERDEKARRGFDFVIGEAPPRLGRQGSRKSPCDIRTPCVYESSSAVRIHALILVQGVRPGHRRFTGSFQVERRRFTNLVEPITLTVSRRCGKDVRLSNKGDQGLHHLLCVCMTTRI